MNDAMHNGNEPFIPAWAEQALGDKPKGEPDQERVMLWAFFDAWEALHAIRGDKRNPEVRKQYESAAQALVDAAHPLKVLRKDHG